MGMHSRTQTLTLLLPRLSPQGSGQDRLTWVPRCSQPSLLSLALPQPCCRWMSSAGSLSDSEFPVARDMSSLSLSVTSLMVSGVLTLLTSYLLSLGKWLGLSVPQIPCLLNRATVMTQPTV